MAMFISRRPTKIKQSNRIIIRNKIIHNAMIATEPFQLPSECFIVTSCLLYNIRKEARDA